jgi:hypothetical protein
MMAQFRGGEQRQSPTTARLSKYLLLGLSGPLTLELPLGKIHLEAIIAQVAPELLAKPHLDIRLVVNNENKEAHKFAAALLSVALRGRMILNSANSPG